MVSSGSQIILTMACSQATFAGELRIAPSGAVDTIVGAITAATWQPFVGRSVRISGAVAGDSLRLDVTTQDTRGEWATPGTLHYALVPKQHATYPDGRLCGGN
jgi:hypothetical protein